MSWEAPDRHWRFLMGHQPPSDLPTPWAAAAQAVTRDLRCRRHGRAITFDNVAWDLMTSDGWVCIGFAAIGGADVSGYGRTRGYTLETTSAQASVWLADEVQEELAGYEFVQWPIDGNQILRPEVVNGRPLWLNAKSNAVAVIGQLCAA